MLKRSQLFILGCSMLLAACGSVNKATGERQLSFISPAQEAQIGAEQHPKMITQFGGEYKTHADLNKYINTIGNDLSAVSEQPDQKWTFTILNSPVVNAFALPGGYVYISRGLMALANSEAEIAGVIGHEIGHVTARHGATRITRSQLVTAGTGLLDFIIGQTTGIKGTGQIADVAGQAYIASYSRNQEYQADALGIRYLGRSGYDQEAQSRFLTSLAANTDFTLKVAGDKDKRRQFDFFASHPNTPARVLRALELARADEVQGGRTARETYLKKIDGMLYGDDPDQGFIIDQSFIHPKLNIRFDMPKEFRIINTPTAVRGIGKNKSIIFDGDQISGGTSLSSYMRRNWLGQNRIRPQRVTSRRINGQEAVTATAPVTLNGRAGTGYFAAIRRNDGNLYRITLLELGPETQNGYNAFQLTLNSFDQVSTSDLERIKVQRIKVIRVRSGDTVASLAKKMDVPQYSQEYFRVLNGFQAHDKLQVGDYVKIVVSERL